MTPFSMRFVQSPHTFQPTVTFDEDVTRLYEALVMATCEALEEAGASFEMSGFGQDPWPVDVAYDMSTVLEQIPELLSSLRRREPGVIDLYGQGIERLLDFRPTIGSVDIRCSSRTSWQPAPEVETVLLEELIEMLVRLCRDVAEEVSRAVPTYAQIEPFPSWRRGAA